MLGEYSPLAVATIFNTMRILKRLNPGDTYLEAYKGHLSRNPGKFFDTYCLLWQIGAEVAPGRILEIGTRTGISLCQLLSSYVDINVIQRVVSIDPYDHFTSPALVRANLKYLNIPTDKMEFIVGKSQDELPKLYESGERFNLILVDGDHSREACRNDMELSHKLLEPGGIMLVDDLSNAPGECGLIVVFDAFKEKHKEEYDYGVNLTGKGIGWCIKK
jgi:predicted O-methyltransferase YrrM